MNIKEKELIFRKEVGLSFYNTHGSEGHIGIAMFGNSVVVLLEN